MSGLPSTSLGQQVLRTAWLFQAAVALPITVILGMFAFSELFGPWMYLYDFVMDAMTALMSAGVIFLVIVQRKAAADKDLTLTFEVAKSVLATGVWLWAMLDSACGPWMRRPYHPNPSVERPKRMARVAISSILLFVLFYPTVLYAYLSWRASKHTDSAEDAEEERPERTPLLSGRSPPAEG